MDYIDNIDYLTLNDSKINKDEEKYQNAKKIFFKIKKKCLNILLVFKLNFDIEKKVKKKLML